MFKRIFWTVITCVFFATCKKNDTSVPTGPIPTPPGTGILQFKNFYVQGSVLKDSSDHDFIMRGNNFPVFWFPTLYMPSLAAASSLNANTARLVWQVQQLPYTPNLSVLDQALAACVLNKLVPVLELHDFTGGTNPSDLITAANYFSRADVKAILYKYNHVLVINIANEWGDGTINDITWKNAYTPAIKIIRDAGYKVPVMIDAPGYGQNENAIIAYGIDLLNSDPLKNLIFSVHAYSNWNNSSTYTNRINAITSLGLCIVFGEFGWNVPDSQQPADFTCRVDAPLLMQICQSKKLGYIGWSWTGNNDANACFDMSTSWSDTSNLTTWGRQWAYDPNGVKNTGIKAYIYQ